MLVTYPPFQLSPHRSFRTFAAGALFAVGTIPAGNAVESTAPATTATPPVQRLDIREFRVTGSTVLPAVEVEEAVTPFLGPGRTADDVEQARAALEKAFHGKGYQGATVQIPPQSGRRGIILLQVSEGRVGKLRVKGARYFLPSDIKERARSMAEGKVVNFNDVSRDFVALNQLPDRRISPSLEAGEVPGTVDIDLEVKDTLPLHGSIELNNRYSAETKPLRLNGSLSYNNLWQAGHSIGGSFQTAPQDPSQVKVYSGYYIWRFKELDWLSLSLQGVKQESNVSTLGSVAVAGRGEVLGARAIITLPPAPNFYQSATFGIDYKNFDQQVALGSSAGGTTTTPVTYYPLSANYGATWAHEKSTTEFNAGVVMGLRRLGSDNTEFENSRFGADGNFIYLRGDLSHTRELPKGFEIFAKVQGQLASAPLVNSEQFGGGGLGTARGYLEAEVLGDNALFGTLEFRSPSLLGWLPAKWKGSEWRIYVFGDAGLLTLNDPLPEEEADFTLASIGIGSHLQLFEYLNGSIDLGLPLKDQSQTKAGDAFVSFRVWADF